MIFSLWTLRNFDFWSFGRRSIHPWSVRSESISFWSPAGGCGGSTSTDEACWEEEADEGRDGSIGNESMATTGSGLGNGTAVEEMVLACWSSCCCWANSLLNQRVQIGGKIKFLRPNPGNWSEFCILEVQKLKNGWNLGFWVSILENIQDSGF